MKQLRENDVLGPFIYMILGETYFQKVTLFYFYDGWKISTHFQSNFQKQWSKLLT